VIFAGPSISFGTIEVALARSWARHLAQELQRTRAIAEMLSLKTVAERLESWIALNDGGLPPKGRWRADRF
jgi:hypothetical protein